MSRNYASLLLEVLRHEGVEQAHAEAGAPLRDGRLVLGGPGNPGDVEASPRRAVLDEALQELRGGDRAAGAPATAQRVARPASRSGRARPPTRMWKYQRKDEHTSEHQP